MGPEPQASFWRRANIQPFPERHVVLNSPATFTAEDMKFIRLGNIASAMEEKWDIFTEGDSTTYARSWTGFIIFIARFDLDGEVWRVSHLRANRDPEQYHGSDDDEDIRFFEILTHEYVINTWKRSHGLPLHE
jgi:hypothetical protein